MVYPILEFREKNQTLRIVQENKMNFFLCEMRIAPQASIFNPSVPKSGSIFETELAANKRGAVFSSRLSSSICFCAPGQRQIGETTLNETSSTSGPGLDCKFLQPGHYSTFRLYLTNFIRSCTNQTQKIHLVIYNQTVQLVTFFTYI